MNTVCSATNVAAVVCRSHTIPYTRAIEGRLSGRCREIGEAGVARFRAPEQCLIGNRATNNYPYARIRAAHVAYVAIGLSWRGANCGNQWHTPVTIKIAVARQTTIDDASAIKARKREK